MTLIGSNSYQYNSAAIPGKRSQTAAPPVVSNSSAAKTNYYTAELTNPFGVQDPPDSQFALEQPDLVAQNRPPIKRGLHFTNTIKRNQAAQQRQQGASSQRSQGPGFDRSKPRTLGNSTQGRARAQDDANRIRRVISLPIRLAPSALGGDQRRP